MSGMNTFEEKIGGRAKQYREAAGLSQEQLAEKMRAVSLRWSQATVWSVENGSRPLRLSEARALALACGFEPQDFFAEEPMLDEAEYTRGIYASINALFALLPNTPEPPTTREDLDALARSQTID